VTLTKLKANFKLVALLTAFFVYSSGLFLLGKYTDWKLTSNAQGQKVSGQNGVQKPQPENETQSASVLGSTVKLCSNTTYSFQLAYPQDWFTTYNTKDQACNYFAPYSFVLPQIPSENITPITIQRMDPENWDIAVKSAQNPNDLYNIEKTQNIEINGKPVQYVEAASTGSSIQRGFVKASFFVFDANNPLEITYTQLDEKENVIETKKVLNDIANSLKFF